MFYLSCVDASVGFFPAINTQICTKVNQTETISHHQIHQGQSTTISCHYSKKRSQALAVYLRTNQRLCDYNNLNTTWTKQFCNDDIRFLWIPETEEISFQLLNLQINDSGVYTCTVEHYFPPPTRCLGQERIFIHVTASPSVSVACVRGHDGAPTMLCASEGFYPAGLKQAWLRDGEYISYMNTALQRPTYEETLSTSHINWTYRNNTDGSYSLLSYLHLSADIKEQVMYYCWVNHTTLSKPITVIMSSTECTEREVEFTGMNF
ncbi:uncharacterized protein LOC131367116 [Hemibagrus wyckioides]|uniref:uncharacterized protein LOC131367116 n=1 Tax=Hemibagrus wyckioides TaxID=337641 RepID=UPI00266B49AA|nr:uncharacterized protein LOC131367116 [Hemibagrus wyckioides]